MGDICFLINKRRNIVSYYSSSICETQVRVSRVDYYIKYAVMSGVRLSCRTIENVTGMTPKSYRKNIMDDIKSKCLYMCAYINSLCNSVELHKLTTI